MNTYEINTTLKKHEKYYKVKQHRARKKDLGNKQRSWVTKNYPNIKDNDMVELVEYCELELQNTWEVDDE